MGFEDSTSEDICELQCLFKKLQIDKQCLGEGGVVCKLEPVLLKVVEELDKKGDEGLLATLVAIGLALFEVPKERQYVVAQLLSERGTFSF